MAIQHYPLKAYTGSVPKYCPNCGRLLSTFDYYLGFDKQTGEEKIGLVLYCPKYGKWFSHYTVSFDEEGHEIVEYY